MKKTIYLNFIIIIMLLSGCQLHMFPFTPKEQSPTNPMDHHRHHQREPMHDNQRKNMEENNKMPGHMNMMHSIKLQNSTGENELMIPPLLEPRKKTKDNVYYDLEAKEGEVQFFPNVNTKTLGYNGDFLGPAIKVKQDENVHIQFKNSLQEDTTIHWHGLIVGGPADGGPHDVIRPGEEKEINFPIQQDAATLWFHPHPLGKTAKQVYEGLAGLLLIEGEYDEQFTYGEDDFPLIIQDRLFTEDKQLNYEEAYHPDGTTGDTLLINGTINPYLELPRTKIRLRLLNGSNKRNLTFSFNNDMEFEQIASDGGLLNEPIAKKTITLAPSERVEIIVDLTEIKDDIALLANDETEILPIKIINTDSANELNKINKKNDATVTEEEKALPIAKHIELFGMGPHVTINGKKFDPDRIDFTQEKGKTEIWEIYNKPDMIQTLHPFHIHGTQFKIISINGKDPPAHLQGYKDTIDLQPGDKAKLAVTFEEEGTYMYHCHILEHEDNGMMGQVQVK